MSSADDDLAPHNVFKFFDDDKEGENENEAVADYTSTCVGRKTIKGLRCIEGTSLLLFLPSTLYNEAEPFKVREVQFISQAMIFFDNWLLMTF